MEAAMAVCPVCGASTESKLCEKCGAAIGEGPSATRKRRMLFLALGGCLGLIILTIVIIGGFVRFLHKSGIDPVLMAKQPAHAAANMIAKSDPDLEIVSADEKTGIVQVRYRKSGVMMEMNVKDGRNAKLIAIGEQRKNINRSQSLPFDNSHCPAWLPRYPGAVEECFKPNSTNENNGSVEFKTTDSSRKVAAFYKDSFEKDGFMVETYEHPNAPKDARIHIIARHASGSRFASINVNLWPLGGSHEPKRVVVSFRK
jgi:hypothetical protein